MRIAGASPSSVDPDKWARGAYTGASLLSHWVAQGEQRPTAKRLMERAHATSATASIVDVAAAVALSGRADAYEWALQLVCTTRKARTLAVPDGAKTGRGRIARFATRSVQHALLKEVASARTPIAVAVCRKMAQRASVPSLHSCIATAIAADRDTTALALVRVAIERDSTTQQGQDPALSAATIRHWLSFFWDMTTEHGSVSCVRAMAIAIGFFLSGSSTVRPPAERVLVAPIRPDGDVFVGGVPDAETEMLCEALRERDAAQREIDAPATRAEVRVIDLLLGSDLAQAMADHGAPPADPFYANAAIDGRVAFFRLARACRWRWSKWDVIKEAMVHGSVALCDAVYRWHVADSGPENTEHGVWQMFMRALMRTMGHRRSVNADHLCATIEWLYRVRPGDESAPDGDVIRRIVDLDQTPPWFLVAMFRWWPDVIAHADCLGAAVGAHIAVGLWSKADEIVRNAGPATLAAHDSRNRVDPTIGITLARIFQPDTATVWPYCEARLVRAVTRRYLYPPRFTFATREAPHLAPPPDAKDVPTEDADGGAPVQTAASLFDIATTAAKDSDAHAGDKSDRKKTNKREKESMHLALRNSALAPSQTPDDADGTHVNSCAAVADMETALIDLCALLVRCRPTLLDSMPTAVRDIIGAALPRRNDRMATDAVNSRDHDTQRPDLGDATDMLAQAWEVLTAPEPIPWPVSEHGHPCPCHARFTSDRIEILFDCLVAAAHVFCNACMCQCTTERRRSLCCRTPEPDGVPH